MRRLVLLILAVSSIAAARPPAQARTAYERARKLYFDLKASPGQQQYRHRWIKVIAGFTEVTTSYAKAPEASRALYTTAELWADLYKISRTGSDLDQALTAYARLPREYRDSSLADDAMLERARLLIDKKGDRARASTLLTDLLVRYPKGDRAKDATALLRTLKGVVPAAQQKDADAPLVGRRDDVGPIPTLGLVKHWSNPVYTRVVAYLSGPAQVRTVELPAEEGAPARFAVDVSRARMGQDAAPSHAIDDDLLSRVTATPQGDDTVRLLLDLKTAVEPRVMTLENPYRVVIDAYVAEAPADTEPPKKPLVVLDAGHGGHDCGALGPKGLKEKDVTLAIVKEAKDLLLARGYDVLMTRADDTYVSLEERTAVANRAQAAVFVSVHANSHKRKAAAGIETYYLDTTDDRYALRLAARENHTQEERVTDVQLVLADLATKVNTRASFDLAKRLQESAVAAAKPMHPKVRDLGVKSSLFYVLLGARMPAVLLETAFISNPDEAGLLADKEYRHAMAEAVASAVSAQLDPAVIAAR